MRPPATTARSSVRMSTDAFPVAARRSHSELHGGGPPRLRRTSSSRRGPTRPRCSAVSWSQTIPMPCVVRQPQPPPIAAVDARAALQPTAFSQRPAARTREQAFDGGLALTRSRRPARSRTTPRCRGRRLRGVAVSACPRAWDRHLGEDRNGRHRDAVHQRHLRREPLASASRCARAVQMRCNRETGANRPRPSGTENRF